VSYLCIKLEITKSSEVNDECSVDKNKLQTFLFIQSPPFRKGYCVFASSSSGIGVDSGWIRITKVFSKKLRSAKNKRD
jgi:hypothetical protein